MQTTRLGSPSRSAAGLRLEPKFPTPGSVPNPCTHHTHVPVVILEPDVASGPQHLSILQPRDVRGRLALRLAREHGGGPSWPGDGLGVLDKLCWGWTGGTERQAGQ